VVRGRGFRFGVGFASGVLECEVWIVGATELQMASIVITKHWFEARSNYELSDGLNSRFLDMESHLCLYYKLILFYWLFWPRFLI
jgi:hypothetical protein